MVRILLLGLFTTVLNLGASVVVYGQDPAVFSQFSLNPFQFNPSYAASNGYSEINLFYRKQWIGIENAPEVGAVNFQAPVGRSVSLGLTVISNKTILLHTNTAMATFGYRVRFGLNHHLNFGLSGGLELNNFDGEAIATSSDPALANVVLNNRHVAGQVGINYQLKNFNIGFALPKLFESRPDATEGMEPIELNPLLNKFGSASYLIKAGSVEVQPTVIYRSLDEVQDQWEGMLTATFKKMIWIGASYRDGYGLTGLIGIRIKGAFKVGYAYEHPTGSISHATTGSHEIYFGARIGKQNREEVLFAEMIARDSIRQIEKAGRNQAQVVTAKEDNRQQVNEDADRHATEVEQDNDTDERPVVETNVEPPTVADNANAANKTAVETPSRPDAGKEQVKSMVSDARANPDTKAGYYVVVGVYRNAENAINQIGSLRSKGYRPSILYIEEKDYYYVHLLHTQDRNEALFELRTLQQKNQFFGAWIFNNTHK